MATARAWGPTKRKGLPKGQKKRKIQGTCRVSFPTGFSAMKPTASVSAMPPPVCGTSVQELEAFLRENVSGLQQEEEESSGGAGRPRELAETCLWVGLLGCLLRGLQSQKAIWRVL